VAAAAAGILIGDGHAGAIYNATGPERLSGAELAALIAEITGRPLAFLAITEKQQRAGLTQAGLPVEVVKHRHQHPGELRGGCVRHCDRRSRAPWRPAAQASPRRACWGAEISFGLKTCTAGARKAYEEFLHLWKYADPEIQIYREAKTEYAKLP